MIFSFYLSFFSFLFFTNRATRRNARALELVGRGRDVGD